MDEYTEPMQVIGRTTSVDFIAEHIPDVPAKIDTGADSSSIWASDLHIDDNGHLSYKLFAKGSVYYTGKTHATSDYDIVLVKSAHGSQQVRYRTKILVSIDGRKIRGTFTLADRSKNTYPVLIGCKTLYKKFIVDVSRGIPVKQKNSSNKLTLELQADPKKFFEKYHRDNQRGDIEL